MPPHDAMQEAWPLIAGGAFLLIGFVAHVAGRRAHVPRVTLLLLIGVIVGPSVLGLVPPTIHARFPLISEVALSMVGFILGEQFLGAKLRALGRTITMIAVVQTLVVAAAVFAGLLLIGTRLELALLLAAVAPASAPAATADVVQESGAKGELTDTVLGVVAVDDAFGIILFSFLLVMAEMITGTGIWNWESVGLGIWEVGGSVALGAALGFPMAWMTGRVRAGELTLVEALGFVLLCGGLATAIGVSYLLSCMTLGAVVANYAKHHRRPFHEIEGVSQAFLVVFFLMAGFEFDLSQLAAFGLPGGVYIVARIAGKIGGGILGAQVGGASARVRRYVGWCLLPQAGVALGLGLVASQRFPSFGPTILSLLVGTTFAFEVIGPIATRIALHRSGETEQREDEAVHGEDQEGARAHAGAD